MDDIFLHDLVKNEMWYRFTQYFDEPRQALILLWWVALNNIWDILWNPAVKSIHRQIPVGDIILWWTTPDIDNITLHMAERDTWKLSKIIDQHDDIRNQLDDFASYGNETILVISQDDGKYKIFDGMHRLVGHVLSKKETIDAYVITNYGDFLPRIEPHVIYDIIKSFHRSDKSIEDEQDFIWAIRLLAKNTDNTTQLLQTRFDITHVKDTHIQTLITQALKSNEKNT